MINCFICWSSPLNCESLRVRGCILIISVQAQKSSVMSKEIKKDE